MEVGLWADVRWVVVNYGIMNYELWIMDYEL